LNIWSREPQLEQWKRLVHTIENPKQRVSIGVVGKYVDLAESYKSLHEALIHGGVANNAGVDIVYVDAEQVQAGGADAQLGRLGGILVPGGFGERGSEGKIAAIRLARERKIPFLGICLGMQMAVCEYARSIADLPNAHSSEFDADLDGAVIALMAEQEAVTDMGGTMRLGAYDCDLAAGSLVARIYGKVRISERHRHRYEFNNRYRERLEKAGLRLSGVSPDGKLVEMIELAPELHPFFVGCQFHPEFKSRPTAPHPLFSAYIAASLQSQRTRT